MSTRRDFIKQLTAAAGLGVVASMGIGLSAPQVRAAARDYLPWVAIAPLIGIAAWMLDGIFIGATLTRAMRNAMVQSVAVYAAALVVLLPAFGNHGLWAALMVLNTARGLTMARHYPQAEARAG